MRKAISIVAALLLMFAAAGPAAAASLTQAQMESLLDRIENPGFADFLAIGACDFAFDLVPGSNTIKKLTKTVVKYAKYVKRKYPYTTFGCDQWVRIAIAIDFANSRKSVVKDYTALLSYGLCPVNSQACKDEVRREIYASRGWKPVSA